MKIVVIVCLCTMVLGVVPIAAQTQDTLLPTGESIPSPKSPIMYGLRFGLITGGGAHVERTTGGEWNADLGAGLSAGAFLELPSTQWTTAAINLDFHQVKPEDMPPGFDDDRWMLDVGVMLKMSLRRDSIGTAIRPVFGFSYGRVPGEDNVVSAANFMVLKGGVEGLYFFSRKAGLLFEALLIYAPYGRASAEGPGSIVDDANVRYDLSANIRPLFRIGLILK